MANRYWVGGTGPWDSTTTTNWASTDGGGGGASAPISTDDVFFTTLSNATGYTVTVGSGATCRDVTFASPATGNVTLAGSSTLTVSGSFTLYSGLIRTYTGIITFSSTSTGKTITMAGTTFSNPCEFRFNGSGGGWTFQDNATIYFLNMVLGSVDFNGKTITSAISIAAAATLTTGAATITCADNLSINSGATINAGSLVQFNLSAGNAFNFGGHSFGGLVSISIGNNTPSIDGGNTFTNLTLTGTNANSAYLFTGNNTISSTLTINGSSSIVRLLIRSSVKGTQRTLTAATVVVTNSDFQDIIGAGAGSWNLSAITGLSGDCGGNSGITFTTPVNQYWSQNTGNYSDSSKWFLATGGTGGAGRVPLAQDTAKFDSGSFSSGSAVITQDMVRIGSVDFTGATNTPTWTTSTVCSVFGSITLISGMTFTASTAAYTFEGRGSLNLTNAGKTWAKVLTVDMVSGTLTLLDALIASDNFTVLSGTFSDGGFNVTLGNLISNGSATRAIVFGTGITWTFTSDATNLTTVLGTGLTITPGTATLRFAMAIAGNRNIFLGGKTYYNIVIATTGAFNHIFQDGNTFNNFNIDASVAARTILFTAGTTTTVASMTRDSGTKTITIGSATSAQHTIARTGSTITTLPWMSISRSTVTPSGSVFNAPASTDGGNNSGWNFGVNPSGVI